MNSVLLLSGSVLAWSICVICALILLHRLLRWRGQIMGAGQNLPLLMRTSLAVAPLLLPVTGALMPAAARLKVRGWIDAADLSEHLAPELWVAARTAQGIFLGVAVLVASRAIGYDGYLLAVGGAVLGFLQGRFWLQRRLEVRRTQVMRELPAYLDLLTVCVEAGATLTAAVRMIVERAPVSPLRSYFERVLREVRGGRSRAVAFSHIAAVYQDENLAVLAASLAHAEGSGMSLGQVLRIQAGQRTAERFARAEKLAMQAPVKMLGPLILCIFPCTFVVLAVPIAYRLWEAFSQ